MNTQAITRIIREEKKCLNAIILLLLISCFVSCKKKNDVPANNNEVTATVVVSPASTINIHATASKALMGCSGFGGGTFVEGTNEANAAVIIAVHPPSNSSPNLACVTSTGTYAFDCQYRPNVADPNTPIYGSFGGSITFTAINDHYMEGSFTTVCQCISSGCAFGVDSVVVTGSFKGDHFN